jgi:hypothetical protein
VAMSIPEGVPAMRARTALWTRTTCALVLSAVTLFSPKFPPLN